MSTQTSRHCREPSAMSSTGVSSPTANTSSYIQSCIHHSYLVFACTGTEVSISAIPQLVSLQGTLSKLAISIELTFLSLTYHLQCTLCTQRPPYSSWLNTLCPHMSSFTYRWLDNHSTSSASGSQCTQSFSTVWYEAIDCRSAQNCSTYHGWAIKYLLYQEHCPGSPAVRSSGD